MRNFLPALVERKISPLSLHKASSSWGSLHLLPCRILRQSGYYSQWKVSKKAAGCSGRLHGIAVPAGVAMIQHLFCRFGDSWGPFCKTTQLISLRGKDSFTRVMYGPECQFHSIDLQGVGIYFLMTKMIFTRKVDYFTLQRMLEQL